MTQDIQRPLYLTAKDAIAYGIVDKVVDKNSRAIDSVLSGDAWDDAAGLVSSPSGTVSSSMKLSCS